MNKTINIACHYASIYGGNFIPSILEVASSLKKKGFLVIFTFPLEAKNRNWTKYIRDLKFEIIFIDFSVKSFKKELKKIIKSNKIDILYTHFISGLRIKSIFPFNKDLKLLIHVHSDFSGGATLSVFERIKNFFEHHILRKDAKYIFVSKDMADNFKRHDRYIYIGNALSLNRIPCDKLDLIRTREENQLKNSDTIFLVFAWSPFVKGLDVAIKGFLDGAKGCSNAKLIVIYGKNDGYQQCISYLINKFGNNEFLNDKRIVFLPPSEDVFSYYSLSDIFISSSRSEGFSYSILEALYFNLKVLSSDIVGTKWANQFENVYPFKLNDEKQLASLIAESISYRKNSLPNKKILEKFDINNWSNQIVKQIERL